MPGNSRTPLFPASGALTLLAALLVGAAYMPSRDAAASIDEQGEAAAISAETDLAAFARAFWPEAKAAGIDWRVYNRAMAGLAADPAVLAKAQAQPEFETPVGEYVARRTSDQKVMTGLVAMEAERDALAEIERTYGVDASVLVAIWGIESNYGSHKGTMSVVRSLATLASTGKRQKYGRQQLIAALQMIQSGDADANAFTGSWAGAMGHTQFIPTTFQAYGVDWDGDGRRDILNSTADALASTANYLKQSGWSDTRAWGAEVTLPADLDYRAALGMPRTFDGWASLGLTLQDANEAARLSGPLKLILPAGHQGPAFLVTKNFDALLAYNQSTAYALAVAMLADRLSGKAIANDWPDVRPLSVVERQELQRRLNELGFDTGGTTGLIGKRTRAAIQAFQLASGLPADGFPDDVLLIRLRSLD